MVGAPDARSLGPGRDRGSQPCVGRQRTRGVQSPRLQLPLPHREVEKGTIAIEFSNTFNAFKASFAKISFFVPTRMLATHKTISRRLTWASRTWIVLRGSCLTDRRCCLRYLTPRCIAGSYTLKKKSIIIYETRNFVPGGSKTNSNCSKYGKAR